MSTTLNNTNIQDQNHTVDSHAPLNITQSPEFPCPRQSSSPDIRSIIMAEPSPVALKYEFSFTEDHYPDSPDNLVEHGSVQINFKRSFEQNQNLIQALLHDNNAQLMQPDEEDEEDDGMRIVDMQDDVNVSHLACSRMSNVSQSLENMSEISLPRGKKLDFQNCTQTSITSAREEQQEEASTYEKLEKIK